MKNLLAPISNIGAPKWCSNDSEQEYFKNLQAMPSSWYYRRVPVHYSFNSNGYRCPEWGAISWADSIVVLGCSIVLGVGIDDSDTITSQLENKTNIPTVNLGIGGSSNQLMLHNTIQLITNGLIPKAVVVVFTDPSRISLLGDKSTKTYGSWVLEKELGHSEEVRNFFHTWNADSNADTQGITCARAVELVWKSTGIPVVTFQTYGSWCLDMGYKKLVEPVDLARDLQHGGVESQKVWADQIKEQLGL